MNFDSYDLEMRKSMRDKMFFMDHFEADVYVDYGCADATLFEFMSQVNPNKFFIGFDISEEQLERARAKKIENAAFTSNWDEVETHIRIWKSHRRKTAIICNSVIHEVYSYGVDAEKFWKRLYNKGLFNFISIRDMGLGHTGRGEHAFAADVDQVRKYANRRLLEEFEDIWGSINLKQNFVHFLLKYRYQKNWDRELHENYFPIDLPEILHMIPDSFIVKHYETFSVPFIKQQINLDYAIDFNINTHYKLILENYK